jgi:acyl-CoA reductase-like NAD-dependent aldehyde dehydrogenase
VDRGRRVLRRLQPLRRRAGRAGARREDLLGTLAAETGASAGFGGFQLELSVSELRQAAGWVYQPTGEAIPSDSPGATHTAVRRPLGVVAGISPWNGALVLAWRTVVAPIAFGNTVVLKPSELAPLSAGLLVAEVMEEAAARGGAERGRPRARRRGRVGTAHFGAPAAGDGPVLGFRGELRGPGTGTGTRSTFWPLWGPKSRSG